MNHGMKFLEFLRSIHLSVVFQTFRHLNPKPWPIALLDLAATESWLLALAIRGATLI